MKRRDSAEEGIVPLGEVIERIKSELAHMETEVMAKVQEVTCDG